MNKTQIEWVKNPDGSQGYTLNPASGCENHTPEGLCLGGLFPCYAYKLANGRLKQRYLANDNFSPISRLTDGTIDLEAWAKANKDPFYPRFWEERLDQLRKQTQRHTKPKGFFVCDMGDLFGLGIPESWPQSVLDTIGSVNNMRHRFYLLTKQPQNLIQWSPFPENCYVGVTATGFSRFCSAHYCLKNLKDRAKVRFLSFEPLLHWGKGASPQPYPDFSRHLKECCDWLIIGACTGSYEDMDNLCQRYPELDWRDGDRFKKFVALPKIEWVREIVEAADKAGIPVFLKDNLKPLFKPEYEVQHPWAYKWGEFRQEMPKGEK